MIDNARISPAGIVLPGLRVVSRITRLRHRIDRKKNYLFCKRVLDILFASLFILCILSWLLPILCVLVKLTSRGPVFFVQKRVGRGGKSFSCYKLRTMIVNNEADILPATEGDNRITPLGCFLRKSNMDEFPQFFNVIKGDMSIIGPRPHMHADCKRFSDLLPGYKIRTLVRPGLTGLAQVKGYHGPSATVDNISMRFHWDNYYLSNLGWRMDARIIFYTIGQRSNALVNHLLGKESLFREQRPVSN